MVRSALSVLDLTGVVEVRVDASANVGGRSDASAALDARRHLRISQGLPVVRVVELVHVAALAASAAQVIVHLEVRILQCVIACTKLIAINPKRVRLPRVSRCHRHRRRLARSDG